MINSVISSCRSASPDPASTSAVTLHRLELIDFRIFPAAAFTPEPDGTTVITGPNGTGKTSVLEAIAYLGTGRSFRNAPRESLVRGSAERAIVRAELQHRISPTLVEAEIVPTGRSRTQVNRKVAQGRKDLADAVPCTVFSPEDLTLISGGPKGRRDLLDDSLALLDRAGGPLPMWTEPSVCCANAGAVRRARPMGGWTAMWGPPSTCVGPAPRTRQPPTSWSRRASGWLARAGGNGWPPLPTGAWPGPTVPTTVQSALRAQLGGRAGSRRWSALLRRDDLRRSRHHGRGPHRDEPARVGARRPRCAHPRLSRRAALPGPGPATRHPPPGGRADRIGADTAPRRRLLRAGPGPQPRPGPRAAGGAVDPDHGGPLTRPARRKPTSCSITEVGATSERPDPPLDPAARQRPPAGRCSFMAKVLGRLGAPQSLDTMEVVFTRWAEVAGPELAAHAQPIRVQGATLVVGADHPTWVTRCRMESATIVAAIGAMGDTTVQRLEVVLQRPESGLNSARHQWSRSPDRSEVPKWRAGRVGWSVHIMRLRMAIRGSVVHRDDSSSERARLWL